MQKIKNTIDFLRNWAIMNKIRPAKTSFHVAALLYRGNILINHKTGKIIAATNCVDRCAERNLLVLCEQRRINES